MLIEAGLKESVETIVENRKLIYQRAWRQKKKLLGLCIDCGVNPQLFPSVRCEICTTRHYKANRKYTPKGYEKEQKKREERKAQVFNHYGNVCACCREPNPKFLTMDHINNDGYLHRQSVRKDMYRWLIQNNFPTGFQTLCYNCNCARAKNGGICPHKEEQKAIVA